MSNARGRRPLRKENSRNSSRSAVRICTGETLRDEPLGELGRSPVRHVEEPVEQAVKLCSAGGRIGHHAGDRVTKRGALGKAHFPRAARATSMAWASKPRSLRGEASTGNVENGEHAPFVVTS